MITLNGSDGNPFTYRDVDASPNGVIFAQGRLAFSGNYSTGGDTVDFTTLLDSIPSSAVVNFTVFSNGGNLLFQYVPLLGGALNNNKLKISGSGTFGTELAAGAYPAGVTGDTVVWQATFRKLL